MVEGKFIVINRVMMMIIISIMEIMIISVIDVNVIIAEVRALIGGFHILLCVSAL